tara:strand:- start:30 stop:152 length:123 start_codon:yes stop_codon:yes gene_type:complete
MVNIFYFRAELKNITAVYRQVIDKTPKENTAGINGIQTGI